MMKKLKDKSKSRLRIALVAGLFLSGVGAAVAGMWSGLPLATTTPGPLATATLPLTGNEAGAFDTNLSGGRNPQTEQITVSNLKSYMFGNGGVQSLVQNTFVTASGDNRTVGSATCNASRCVVRVAGMVTVANSTYTLTLSNSDILSTSILEVSMGFESNAPTKAQLINVMPGIGLGGSPVGSAIITVLNDNGGTFSTAMRLQVVVIN